MKLARCSALLAIVAIAGCAGHDYAHEYAWSVQVPKTVDKGADLVFKVVATRPASDTADAKEIGGIAYHYQIRWPGGTVQPLRHTGETGLDQKRRAGLVPGTATVVVTREDKEGALVKVAEAAVEVK